MIKGNREGSNHAGTLLEGFVTFPRALTVQVPHRPFGPVISLSRSLLSLSSLALSLSLVSLYHLIM